jgi:hypothetical protein
LTDGFNLDDYFAHSLSYLNSTKDLQKVPVPSDSPTMDISSLTDNLLKFSVPERLRQRLTQRPAAAEASAELYALSRQLEGDDLRVFAAACAEGVAACEGVSENPVAEAEALLRSARLHLEEEIETYRMSLPTMWDSLYYAIDAISKATGKFRAPPIA